jgi:serine/threonine-protein kinase
MLTGNPPFTGSTVQAIVARVLTDRPSPIRTTRDTVPKLVEAAVMTAPAATGRRRIECAGGATHARGAEYEPEA